MIATKDYAPVIVGLSVRLPGARSLGAMWDVLASARCQITQVSDRFFDHGRFYDPYVNRPGRSYSLASGQIDDIFHFDPAFFGISPRAAHQMDPQQRLMLQGTWRAMEDAGLSVADLAGERTGVFIGSSLVENLSLYYYDVQRTDATFALGNELSIIANRISSTFDFRGPSYVVDTACSSGLYALHHGAQALLRGELDTAIVGAVHMARTPGGYVGFSHAKMLSQSGVCRAFDADADGYVRGEAAVVVILQRAEVARRLGAKQRARLLASDVNSDGKTSQITVPSVVQQQNLIEKLFDRTGRDPDDLAFYEAHGTGTPVGDPVEATSLGQALAQLRRQSLLIGSAKTNFGHSEPAAGLVGLAKVLLSFENRAVPASLNFTKPNPHIDFEALNLGVNTELTALAETGPLLAGVNSFGFGGTNAAAFVESLDPPRRQMIPAGIPLSRGKEAPWLLLSASGEGSLAALAQAWAHRLREAQEPAPSWQELAAAQAARPHLTERLALRLDKEAPTTLEKFGHNSAENLSGLLRGNYARGTARNLFLFPGNGVQSLFMGRQEYDASPVFARHYDLVATEFLEQGGPDLRVLMRDPDLMTKIGAPLIAQPLLFGYQYAFARYLQECGLQVDAVLGHSVGEIAALNFAGALSLGDAVHVILSRSRAFESIRHLGGMAVLALDAEEAASIIELSGCDDIEIAAVNSPKSVTIAGPESSLTKLAAFRFSGKKLPFLRLNVEIPYHSQAVESLKEVFAEALKKISFTPPKLEVLSSVTGRVLTPRDCTLDYFWRNARDPVLFSDALTCFAKQTAAIGIEIGPKPSLMANLRDIAKLDGVAVDYFFPKIDLAEGLGEPSLDVPTLLAKAWVNGLRVDPIGLSGPRVLPAPDLPAYPWDEQEYQSPMSVNAIDAWGEGSARWLTGIRAERASGVWVNEFTPSMPTWVADHRVGDSAVLPAAALVDMALGVLREVEPDSDILLEYFDILDAARISGEGLRIRTTFDSKSGELVIEQRALFSDVAWTVVAKGRLRAATFDKAPPKAKPSGKAQDISTLYDTLSVLGLPYGPAFCRVKGAQQPSRDTLWIELSAPKVKGKFSIDFTGLDAALHGLGLRSLGRMPQNFGTGRHALVPVRFEKVELFLKDTPIALARLDVRLRRQRSIQVDLMLYAADGHAVAKVTGLDLSVMCLLGAKDCRLERIAETTYKLRLRDDPVRLAPKWDRPNAIYAKLGFSRQAPQPSAIERLIREFIAVVQAGESDAAVATIMADIMRHDPDLAPDLHSLWKRLQGEGAAGVAQYGLSHGLFRDATLRLAKAYIKDWPKDQRLNILLVGDPDHVVFQELTEHGGFDQIALTPSLNEGEGGVSHLLGRSARPFLRKENEPDALYDLIICTGLQVQIAQSKEALAEGGVLVSLYCPALQIAAHHEDEAEEWYGHAGDFTLKLTLQRAKAKSQLKPLPLYDTLLHDYQGLASLSEELGVVLSQLRYKYLQDGPALVVFLRDCSAGNPYFAALSSGVAAGLRVWRNEDPRRDVGLVVLKAADLNPEQAEAKGWVQAALEWQVVEIDAGAAATKAFVKLAQSETSGNLVLEQEDPGNLDGICWQPAPSARLGEGEVEIEVEEIGLNFRDVMLARGMLPERILDFGHSTGFGMECAGRIRRLGPGVKDHLLGERVMTLASGAFGNRVVVPALGLIKLGQLKTAAAASIPVAYLTAWHALHGVARLQPGESLLIHGAAGGVGLAALQVAVQSGARVFATAGTPYKRLLALSYGAEKVFDSRDLSFAEAIKRQTDGRGVDVVVNSLAGTAMQASLEIVAPFGRFIELGKRDFIESNSLNLRFFLRNISYFGLDLDQYLAAKPREALEALKEAVQRVQRGELQALPTVTYPAQEVSLAYHKMLKAGHVGKIVASPPKPRRKSLRQKPIKGTWVLLGGTGGIGIKVAQRLLAEGAEEIHLISRGGIGAVLKSAHREWLEQTPAVQCHMFDAADVEALSAFFAGLSQADVVVEGVVHCAMLLRDRTIRDLNHDETDMVLRSKVAIAEALDSALQHSQQSPAHVVFFSSISALIGTSGQFSYAAANAAVQEMARIRQATGLPGLAIGWGPVADAGYLIEDHALAKRLARQPGLRLLSIKELCDELIMAIKEEQKESYLYSAQNWNDLALDLPAVAGRPFDRLLSEKPMRFQPVEELSTILKGLGDKEALEIITLKVKEIISSVLGFSADNILINAPLVRSGVDSLMAVELRLAIESQFGCLLPVSSITREVTAFSLSVEILKFIRERAD